MNFSLVVAQIERRTFVRRRRRFLWARRESLGIHVIGCSLIWSFIGVLSSGQPTHLQQDVGYSIVFEALPQCRIHILSHSHVPEFTVTDEPELSPSRPTISRTPSPAIGDSLLTSKSPTRCHLTLQINYLGITRPLLYNKSCSIRIAGP